MIGSRHAWLLACAGSFAAASAASASVGLIDDFNTPDGAAGFTLSRVLDFGDGTTQTTYDEAGGALNVTLNGATGTAEQALFLAPVSLGAGEELQLDVADAVDNGGRDFGIAVGQTPVALAEGAAGDNRSLADYVFLAMNNKDATGTSFTSRGFIGNSELDLLDANDGALFENQAGVTQLFITRLANDDLEFGFYQGETRNVLATRTPVSSDIYDNVGFYTDLRTDGNGWTGADNLRIVPEPASLALLGLGGLAVLGRRRSA